jgi:hypothetical protein
VQQSKIYVCIIVFSSPDVSHNSHSSAIFSSCVSGRKLKQALLTIRSPAVLITFAQLYAWNPAVGSNCESLWASEAYCVGIPGSKSTTSITTSTTSTSNIVPGPTQTGIISTCNKYYLTPASGKHSRESSNLTHTKASIYRLIMRRNRVTV